MGGFARAILRPAFVFIFVLAIVFAIIIGIGTTLLTLHPEMAEGVVTPNLEVMASEFLRPELITAFALSVLVLFVGAFLARQPAQPRKLDEPLALGKTPIFAEVAPPPTDEEATRRGPQGTWADVQPGFTLYARNGPLAKVVAVLPAEAEYGKTRRGLLYASGLYGANEEMWIPIEAVYAVYPETGSAFLAAKGDEIEHFGWNLPPQSFRRVPGPHTPLSSF